jgi:hypothetical protein
MVTFVTCHFLWDGTVETVAITFDLINSKFISAVSNGKSFC